MTGPKLAVARFIMNLRCWLLENNEVHTYLTDLSCEKDYYKLSYLLPAPVNNLSASCCDENIGHS